MRLCTFRSRGDRTTDGRPGRVGDGHVVVLEAATLLEVLAASGPVAEGAAHRLEDVELLAPIPRPPAIRDFYAFEQHVATTRGNRGSSVPDEWYEIPVFYFSNPAAIYGPDVEIPFPRGTSMLDYELEVAAVLRAGGEIGGFTIMNDWSARDLQRRETRVGLGPAKGKDFATSIGPVLVTPDEFDGTAGEMVARVNGEERSRGNLADMFYGWDTIVAQAAENTTLRPGDIIGSGTVGTGCILEHDDGRWLRPGDVVDLEVEGLGVLRNRIGEIQVMGRS